MKKILVIKIGGKLAQTDASIELLAHEMLRLKSRHQFLVVHGGGAEVTSLTRKMGIEPVFHHGIRLTSPEEMDFVDMVLSGLINKKLIRLFRRCGANAVGLSGSDGGVFTGESIGIHNGIATRTGNITEVNTDLLKLLLAEDYLPVISSTSADKNGCALNINADVVAFSLSSHLQAHGLIFLSDIPGILKNGSVIQSITVTDALEEIKAGTISGGMVPKVESSIEALSNGVSNIMIGEYTKNGSLDSLLHGQEGTLIHTGGI